ncbi:MAG: hypothetical protein AAF737_01285 [Pseudomonadota bacterium]
MAPSCRPQNAGLQRRVGSLKILGGAVVHGLLGQVARIGAIGLLGQGWAEASQR